MTITSRVGRGLPGALLVAVGFAGVPTVGAYYAGGGKDAAKGNDCLIGYQGIDASDVTLEGKKQVVTCMDCDPACDADGVSTANGSCLIQLGVCINQSGVAGCTPPSALDKASAKGKVKGVKGADGKIVIDTSQLLQGSECGAFVDVTIPIKNTTKVPKDGQASLTLSGSVKKNKSEGIAARSDKDKLTIVCQARPLGDPCPISTTTTSTASTTSTISTSTTLQSGNLQDWGDGTIRDTSTGLQWEKKATTVGSGMDAANLDDVDNLYLWAGACSVTTSKQCQPSLAAETACKAQTDAGHWSNGCEQCVGGEGTCRVDPFGTGAITTGWQWLSQVNAANYAGYNDWRLPSESGCDTCPPGFPPYSCTGCLTPSAHELETILLSSYPCGTSRPCIASIFGPTASDGYWSGSSSAFNPAYAWSVYFGYGNASARFKTESGYVRAVRSDVSEGQPWVRQAPSAPEP